MQAVQSKEAGTQERFFGVSHICESVDGRVIRARLENPMGERVDVEGRMHYNPGSDSYILVTREGHFRPGTRLCLERDWKIESFQSN